MYNARASIKPPEGKVLDKELRNVCMLIGRIP